MTAHSLTPAHNRPKGDSPIFLSLCSFRSLSHFPRFSSNPNLFTSISVVYSDLHRSGNISLLVPSDQWFCRLSIRRRWNPKVTLVPQDILAGPLHSRFLGGNRNLQISGWLVSNETGRIMGHRTVVPNRLRCYLRYLASYLSLENFG